MGETGAAVERYEERPNAVALLDDREMRGIENAARAIAVLDNRVKSIAGKQERQELAVAMAIQLYSLGLPPTPTNAKKLHLIGDELLESSQLLIGLLQRNGIDVELVESSDERAVVRGRRPGGGWQTITYEIGGALRSGHLDEWVEEWKQAQSGKKYPVKLAIRRDGETVNDPWPDWAQKQVAQGRVKRFDAWWLWRADMLVNRAVRRLAKLVGGDALLGLGPVALEEEESGPPGATTVHGGGQSTAAPGAPADEGDDEVVDAEIVDEGEKEGPAASIPPSSTSCPVDGCKVEGDHAHDSFVANGDKPVSDKWRGAFEEKTDEAGLNPDEKLALLRYATGRTVVGASEVLASETPKVKAAFDAYQAGDIDIREPAEDGPLFVFEAKKEPEQQTIEYQPGEEPFTDE